MGLGLFVRFVVERLRFVYHAQCRTGGVSSVAQHLQQASS